MVVAVIDLDRHAGALEPDPDPLPPRWRRRLGLGLAALLVVAGPGGAAPPTRHLVELATLDSSAFVSGQLAGDTLFAVVSSGDAAELVAYRLDGGTRRWRIPLAVDPGAAWIEVAAGTVLVSSGDPQARAARTVAVDAGTGRELWRSDLPWLPGTRLGRLAVLGAYLAPDGTPGPSPYADPVFPLAAPALRLAGVDLRSGRQLWSYQAPAGSATALPYAAPGDPATALVTVTSAGRASTVDLATGAVRASADIALGAPPPGDDNLDGPVVAVRGDQFVVGDVEAGRPVLTGYRVDTLTRQWRLAVPTLSLAVVACPPLLCLGGGDGVRAVVPATGAVAWTAPQVGWSGMIDRWIYDAPRPLQLGTARLVDPATRRTVLELGDWRLAAQVLGLPALMELVDPDSGRIWLGLLVAGPRVEPLGAVSGLPSDSCDLDAGYLACQTTDHRLRIWRYHR